MPPNRILFVEDDRDTCELIEILLSDADVVCVLGYDLALELIRAEGPFDLYLLDYYLPDRDGLQLCRSIRERDRKTPIVFFTGSRSLQNADVKAAGGQYIVRKSEPNFLEKLKTHVGMLLDPRTDVEAYWTEA